MMKPPYRAEHIGSLLRPSSLLELRRRHARGEIPATELHQAEDAAITDAIAMQERVGLHVVTDGEFRRGQYHDYFYGNLAGITLAPPPEHAGTDVAASPVRGAQPVATIPSRLTWTRPINVDDFAFVDARTKAQPKITLPGPCAVHFRGGDAAILAGPYADTDQFWQDTVDAFTAELSALAEAGCRYVQIDETAFAKFADAEARERLIARGDDPDALIDRYIEITNRVLSRAPHDMAIGMHLCRGNRAGHFHAEGGYDVIAEKLFNAIDVGFYFLEYDSERAGGFEPLRHVPAGKHVVLGLVSTKSPMLEQKDVLKRRIDEASRFIDLDRLALSPQCGFASIDTGNPLTADEQEAKLRLVVEVATEVWG